MEKIFQRRYMFKTKKSLIMLCLVLFVALVIACLCVHLPEFETQKEPAIAKKVQPKVKVVEKLPLRSSSMVAIAKTKDGLKIKGVFFNEELYGKTKDKFSMFNDNIIETKIDFDEKINQKTDKWHDTMEKIAYMFSKSLEDANLSFKDNKLFIEANVLSQSAKDDMKARLQSLEGVELKTKISIVKSYDKLQQLKKDLYELLRSRTVEFASSKSKIKKVSLPLLNEIASKLKSVPNVHLSIEGHTDNTGNAKSNQDLSVARAKAIKVYLVKKGIKSSRISTRGYGQTRPAYRNNSEANKQKNRRVEFKIKGKNK